MSEIYSDYPEIINNMNMNDNYIEQFQKIQKEGLELFKKKNQEVQEIIMI